MEARLEVFPRELGATLMASIAFARRSRSSSGRRLKHAIMMSAILSAASRWRALLGFALTTASSHAPRPAPSPRQVSARSAEA